MFLTFFFEEGILYNIYNSTFNLNNFGNFYFKSLILLSFFDRAIYCFSEQNFKILIENCIFNNFYTSSTTQIKGSGIFLEGNLISLVLFKVCAYNFSTKASSGVFLYSFIGSLKNEIHQTTISYCSNNFGTNYGSLYLRSGIQNFTYINSSFILGNYASNLFLVYNSQGNIKYSNFINSISNQICIENWYPSNCQIYSSNIINNSCIIYGIIYMDTSYTYILMNYCYFLNNSKNLFYKRYSNNYISISNSFIIGNYDLMEGITIFNLLTYLPSYYYFYWNYCNKNFETKKNILNSKISFLVYLFI